MNFSNPNNLFNYLNAHKYKNLHTRHTKQVNKQRVLKHLHGMKWKNKDLIEGYFCGPITLTGISEIQYELDSNGVITVTVHQGMNKKQALEYIVKEFSRIQSRTTQGPITYFPKYSKNNFYLRRSSSTTVTVSGRNAIGPNSLTSDFVNKMASWNLSIIQGSN